MTYQKQLYLGDHSAERRLESNSVLLSIYIAPESCVGLLTYTLYFQSNSPSFWTVPFSLGLEAVVKHSDGLKLLLWNHLFVLPDEVGPGLRSRLPQQHCPHL